MKIGIDARFLTHPQPGGFKTYTENLINSLAQIDTVNEYVLYLDRSPRDQDRIPAQSNFQNQIVSGSLPTVGLPWREQVGLMRRINKDRIDVFHSPCLTAPLMVSCRLVITVHDMIWAFPAKYSRSGSLSIKRKLMEWYNYFVPRYAIQKASAIITVSYAAKTSIIEFSNSKAENIHVTHEAAAPAFRKIKDLNRLNAIRQKYGLSSNYILAIGSADPRKNMSALVQAYSLLPDRLQKEYELAIVWTHSLLTGDLANQIERLGLTHRNRFLEKVPTEDLVGLYNAASLFVFPSLYEGFGLPLLEAMACGAPTIASRNSSIPEIVGNTGLLFDATNAAEISTTMEAVLSDATLRQKLIDGGLRRSAEFSWLTCARETLRIYEQVCSSGNHKPLGNA